MPTAASNRIECDPDVRLLAPSADVADPELSIVIPALNEALTIGEFVDWCRQGIAKAGIRGEILIVDSSTDSTPDIALACGARVLKTPKRGLGRAYIDAIPYIRGKYVLMGDADLTYDFREIVPFVEKFREGCEYIMGSRFRGYIEPGAMPPLHRYLGTPVTTWILNIIYSSRFSDIHCGMRGCTLEALRRIDLKSQSWEYASEMVLKAVRNKLRLAEVPIRFLKDREGRVSHLKRGGWLTPWKAAWMNLRAMFINGADFFLFKPGVVLLFAGLALVLMLTGGPVTIGPITLSIFWMLLGLFMSILGLQFFFMGVLSKMIYDGDGREEKTWLRVFCYDRTAWISALVFLAGFILAVDFIREYAQANFTFRTIPRSAYAAVAGLLAMISAFMSFTFVSLLHAIVIWRKR